MFIRNAGRPLSALVALLFPLFVAVFAAPAATAAPANVAPLAVTVTYDTSRAEEFAADWDAGAEIWNASVSTVRLVKASPGSSADITILADDGWPRAQVFSLGSGIVWMGRTAVDDGYYVVRITAHELGHILGLPDRRTGLCADLMSGSSAPVSCQNARPNAAEAAEVAQNFAGRERAAIPAAVFVDQP